MSTSVKSSETSPNPSLTAMSVAVWRKTDGLWYDFGDHTFKEAPTSENRLAPMDPDPQEAALWTLEIDTTDNAAWTTDYYTFVYYDLTGGTPVFLGTDTEFVKDGQGNQPPNTATISGIDSGSLDAIATRLLDVEQAGGGPVRSALRVAAAGAAGKVVETSDGTETTISDWADPTSTCITSTQSGTIRTTTIH